MKPTLITRSSLLWLGFLTFFFTTSGLMSQDDSDTAIRNLITSYQTARENSNETSLDELFTEDADQLVSSGVWRQGKNALIEGMLQSSRNNQGDRSIEVDRIRYLSSDVAVADARYTIVNASTGNQRNMWSTFIVVRRSDKWLITGIRNMLPAPPAD